MVSMSGLSLHINTTNICEDAALILPSNSAKPATAFSRREVEASAAPHWWGFGFLHAKFSRWMVHSLLRQCTSCGETCRERGIGSVYVVSSRKVVYVRDGEIMVWIMILQVHWTSSASLSSRCMSVYCMSESKPCVSVLSRADSLS